MNVINSNDQEIFTKLEEVIIVEEPVIGKKQKILKEVKLNIQIIETIRTEGENLNSRLMDIIKKLDNKIEFLRNKRE
jgi:hypothetical protein